MSNTFVSTLSRRSAAWTAQGLLPLGALAAGFAGAQTVTPALAEPAAAASAPASAAAPGAAPTTTPAPTSLPAVRISAQADAPAKDSLQATTTTLGKGRQELRDIPQSLTVMTERLMDDRNLDTLKEALHNAAGITFQAGEGGEEDIRVRGFSLAATGDLYVDGMRDPALYDRDTFNNDRIEVLRGSASMLFGRGSTGGVVNQVSKAPGLIDQNEARLTVGTQGERRGELDINKVVGDNAALRLNLMLHHADNGGAEVNKQGVAPTFRWGIGTADEFSVGLYHLSNQGVPNYGIGWLHGGMVAEIEPGAYYGMASDYMDSQADYLSASHTHRFVDGAELRTLLRSGRYTRDFWASTIRFPQDTTTVTADTVLTRGNQGRAHDYRLHYLQTDYSDKFSAAGLRHSLLAGLDLAKEGAERDNYLGSSNPAKPSTTVGQPNDGASLPDTRQQVPGRDFDAKAIGAYVQDMVALTPAWKLVAGLRFDRFVGSNFAAESVSSTGVVTPAALYQRDDNLWSRRLGVLYQPDALWSFHFSYGTSFNTSGDTYSYDALGSNTPAEKSRNLELGAKLDLLEGALSTRMAIFHTEKYNERNRDPDTAATQYLLSGKRHAQGMELEFAGRLSAAWELFASYAHTWEAQIDRSVTATEVGTNPGLTPVRSGAVWTTYQLSPVLRLGAGANGMSEQSPVGNLTVKAPGYVVGELMAEYQIRPVTLKLNIANVSNRLYGDQLYRGHYVSGAPRSVQLTASTRF